MVGKCSQPGRERDPIAELARLIAHADTHEESAPSDNCFREETVSDGYNETSELPPAPQLPVALNEHDQACEHDEDRSDAQAHDVDDELYATEEKYQDSEAPHCTGEEFQDGEIPLCPTAEEHPDNEVPRVRRRSLTLVMAMFGLALLGSACAVGYRNMFGGSIFSALPPTLQAINAQNRIAPAPNEPKAIGGGNARQIGPATTGSIDNMVSREEQPATVAPPKTARRSSLSRTGAPMTSTADQAIPNQAVPRVAVTAGAPAPPAAIAATPQGLDQSTGADATAPPYHEHFAAVPVAHANSDTAAVTAPVVASGYAVQVTSERSEVRAQAAFRALQAKYPNELSGHQPIIRRADLGAAGIYYRALVGPFASAKKAAKMCSGVKAVGGDCIVQKN